MKPITQQTVDEWTRLSIEAGKYEQEIISRIDYIITTIFKIYDYQIDCWYFLGAGEGEVGDLHKGMDATQVHLIIEFAYRQPMRAILRDGSEWVFDDGFPTRFLFEDFEQEVIDGIAKFIAHKESKKQKKKAQHEEQKALVASAKSKLTKKEWAAIRKNL